LRLQAGPIGLATTWIPGQGSLLPWYPSI